MKICLGTGGLQGLEDKSSIQTKKSHKATHETPEGGNRGPGCSSVYEGKSSSVTSLLTADCDFYSGDS